MISFDNVMLLGKKATSRDIKHQPVVSGETVLHGLRNSSISPEPRLL